MSSFTEIGLLIGMVGLVLIMWILFKKVFLPNIGDKK